MIPNSESGMKVNTDSGMKPNSFRPIPEPVFGFAGLVSTGPTALDNTMAGSLP
jgi:hypothetical protein